LAVGIIERDLGGRPVELTVCGSLVLIHLDVYRYRPSRAMRYVLRTVFNNVFLLKGTLFPSPLKKSTGKQVPHCAATASYL
jgi:hypothetical protein